MKPHNQKSFSITPKPSLETRRNMARVLAAAREFNSVEIDRALSLPKITTAGFLAAASRYGDKVLAVREE